MMEETWKTIERAPAYAVSSLGRVKALQKTVRWWRGYRTIKEKFLKYRESKEGYFRVGIYIGNRQKWFFVHQFVIEAFGSPRPDGYECNHKDTVKKNNRPENLEWLLHIDNQKHAVQNGCYNRGENVFGAKLKEGEVWLIKKILHSGVVTQRMISKMFRVSDTTISDIKLGKIWTHILFPEETL